MSVLHLRHRKRGGGQRQTLPPRGGGGGTTYNDKKVEYNKNDDDAGEIPILVSDALGMHLEGMLNAMDNLVGRTLNKQAALIGGMLKVQRVGGAGLLRQ